MFKSKKVSYSDEESLYLQYQQKKHILMGNGLGEQLMTLMYQNPVLQYLAKKSPSFLFGLKENFPLKFSIIF